MTALAAFLVVALAEGSKPFYYDSGVYWALSDTFSHNGHFSLLSFENQGVRGYALPLIYHFVHRGAGLFTGDEALMVMVFNAAIFALIGAGLAPKIAQLSWPTITWGMGRRLALCALIVVFWSGYLSFPLSDFPALAAVMLAIIAVSAPESPLAMLGAGAAAALALDIRPAYILLIPLLLLVVFWSWYERRGEERSSNWRRLLCITLFALGCFCVSLPQSLSQDKNFGSYNPIPGGNGLAGLQYTEGLRLQRYHTYVGNELKTPQMDYLDPHTKGILAELPGEKVSSTGEYLSLAFDHPLTIGGVFLRHLVNGLDQRYTTPYVEHLDFTGQDLLRVAGFLIVFLALLRVAWPTARKRLGSAQWRYPAVLLLVCATALPSAVETRFLLPVFVLAATLVVIQGWPNPLGPPESGARRYRALALIALSAIFFFAVVGVIVSGASDNLRLI